MNLDQHKAIQPRIVELQRAALEFAEIGESKVSRLILAACFAAQKLKPAKPASGDQLPLEPNPVVKLAKGKGA
ncbi:hypothetical protein [Xanthomonas albilineans]|uniref:hypothetical protein n=1 Tax=Xanthomonas albilineans TaxID=29447 RepID=UPI0027D941AF|nr:hypothetical protein [Xanthomonas albilineans]